MPYEYEEYEDVTRLAVWHDGRARLLQPEEETSLSIKRLSITGEPIKAIDWDLKPHPPIVPSLMIDFKRALCLYNDEKEVLVCGSSAERERLEAKLKLLTWQE